MRRKARLGLVCSAIFSLTILTERICVELFLICTNIAMDAMDWLQSRIMPNITLGELKHNFQLVSFMASFLFCSVLLIGCLPSEWSLHLFLEHLFVPLLQYKISAAADYSCDKLAEMLKLDTCDQLKHELAQLCCVIFSLGLAGWQKNAPMLNAQMPRHVTQSFLCLLRLGILNLILLGS